MIQRIQSVYLLLTTILAGIFLIGNIFSFSVSGSPEFIMKISGLYKILPEENLLLISKAIPLMLVSVIIPVLSLITFFLYKSRKLQVKIVVFLLALNLLLIALTAWYGFAGLRQYEGTFIPSFRMFIPLVLIIVLLLALRSIKKDEELVKSYERLR